MLLNHKHRGPRPLFFIVGLCASVALTSCNRGEGAQQQQGAGSGGGGGQNGGAGGGGGAQRGNAGGGGGAGGAGGGQRGPGGGGGFGGPGGFNRPTGPIAIEVAVIKRGSVAREATVAGVLAPVRSIGVNAQTGGALLSVRVEEGDVVREGQVLAEIDAREVRAQVRSAEASLTLAKSTAERSAALLKDRVVTTAEYERDQASLAAAQATLDALRTRLGYALVRAPTSGVITEKRNEAGDVIGSQSRLFTVADVSTLVVRVQVSELDIAGLSIGQKAEVTVDALGAAPFTGTIRRIFPAADSITRMVPVEVGLSGPAVRQLRPGYLARVTVKLGERSDLLLAPVSAVVGARDARAVYLKQGDKVERRPVRIGQTSGEFVEVHEGLVVGDTVVSVGAEQLRDGAQVRIVPPIGAAPPPGSGDQRRGRVVGGGDSTAGRTKMRGDSGRTKRGTKAPQTQP
jgi:membrane fusion protein (multidrug efflux system)